LWTALYLGWLTVNQFRLSIGDRAASVRWQSNLGDPRPESTRNDGSEVTSVDAQRATLITISDDP
jgi:hypothetical protein